MNTSKKRTGTLIAGGAIVLTVALLAGGFLFANSALASPISLTGKSGSKIETRINGVRARWNNEKWEYSTDGGKTWTNKAPDGVNVSEDGGLTVWQGEGTSKDYDAAAWQDELEQRLESIYSDIDQRLKDVLPEEHEDWGSYVRLGDAIARRTENGSWEYSEDGGETWTDKAPKGFSVSEDGTKIKAGDN